MQWHIANAQRWQQEQTIAIEVLENSIATIDGEGTAMITGDFPICSEHGRVYEFATIQIRYPENFPDRNQPPNTYLMSHRDRWENCGDSHIEVDWRLCLFVPGESGIDFSSGESLNELFAVLTTYLLKQRIYQLRLIRAPITGVSAKWPGDDRSHGLQGIWEAIDENGGIGRNAPCPCGSGKKYKKCHMRQIQSWQRKVYR